MPDRQMNTLYVLKLALIAALGGLLFGYDISVISGTLPFITDYFDLNDWWKGFVVSSVYIGCMIGASVAGKFSDRFGRKPMLLISSILFGLSAIGSGLSTGLTEFFIYRMVGGLGVGMASLLSPMYIAEVSPAPVRGRLVSINQFAIVIGILAAYFVNYILVDSGAKNWRWMFMAEAIPSLGFLVGIFFIPESPRWLVKRNDTAAAKKILNRVGGPDFARSSLQDISDSLSGESKQNLNRLLHGSIRPILLIGIILAVFQQWSGINVIFFYAPDIFASTGISVETQLGQTVLVGIVNMTFTIMAMWLVERMGRRKLMLIGSAGMAVCYIIIGSLFHSGNPDGYGLLIVVLCTIAFYATSLAPVTWVLISELFPNKVRGLAMAIATFFLWMACYILTLTFPVMMEHLSAAPTFWIYAFICISGFIFIIFKVPETSGKTLEELENYLIKRKP